MIFKEYQIPITHNNYFQSVYFFECRNPDRNNFFIPDGNLELMFSDCSLSVLAGNRRIIHEERNLFWGQINFTGTIESPVPYKVFGIKFQPWVLHLLKRGDTINLIDKVLPLDKTLSKSFINTLEQFFISWKFEEPNMLLIENITSEFKSEVSNRAETKANFKNAITVLKSCNGICLVSDLQKEHKQSLRTLEYDFKKYIGISAKEFQSIIRFRKASINFLSNRNALDTALDFGYYDQAHFTNYFTKKCLKSPGTFLKEGNLILSSI